MKVVAGEAGLAELESPNLTSEEVYQRLLRLPGALCVHLVILAAELCTA